MKGSIREIFYVEVVILLLVIRKYLMNLSVKELGDQKLLRLKLLEASRDLFV